MASSHHFSEVPKTPKPGPGTGFRIQVSLLGLAQKVSCGAEIGSRTRTSLRTSVFETDASAIPPPRRGPYRPLRRGSTISFAGATHVGRPAVFSPGRLCTDRPVIKPGRQHHLHARPFLRPDGIWPSLLPASRDSPDATDDYAPRFRVRRLGRR